MRLLEISTDALGVLKTIQWRYSALTSTSTLLVGTTICSCLVGMGGFLYWRRAFWICCLTSNRATSNVGVCTSIFGKSGTWAVQPSVDKVQSTGYGLVFNRDTVLHPEHIVHLVHFAPFVFVHTVDIGVHCECYGVMAENGRQCFVVHAALQRTGGKGMPQGVEGKVSDVGIIQQSVIVILESFLFKVVTEFVGDDEAIVGVLIPCPLLILRLLLFPAGKLVCHCAGQRNHAAGVFRFWCAEYDFSFVLTVVGFVLGKAVDGAPLRNGQICRVAKKKYLKDFASD